MTSNEPSRSIRDVMAVEPAMEALTGMRTATQIVVTNQIAARLWPHFSNHQLDINYNPSTMGGAVPLALGIATARPDHEVVIVSGEGALLMSLGSLVTVIDSGATNLTVIALDNAAYEVTGGQRTPASASRVNFARVAEGIGFATVAHFSQLEDWSGGGPAVFTNSGPRFIWLEVQTCQQPPQSIAGPSLREQVAQLSQSLGGA